jgi:hypothetical protein
MGGMMILNKRNAVQITHKPTGITAEVDSDRSQYRNRNKAMNLLRARLAAQAILAGPLPLVRTYELADDQVYPPPLDLP